MRTDPHPGLLQHRPCPYDQNQEPSIRICEHWKCSHNVCVNSECLCSNALLLYEQQNNNFIFTCTNKLEYVNYHFFPKKGDVQINKVHKLLQSLWYLDC